MRKIFAIVVIAAIAGAIGIGLNWFSAITPQTSLVSAAICFVVLLVLFNTFTLHRYLNQMKQHVRDADQFEKKVNDRLRLFEFGRKDVEIEQEAPSLIAEMKKSTVSNPDKQIVEASNLLTKLANSRKKSGKRGNIPSVPPVFKENEHANGNIIAISSHLERQSGSKGYKLKPAKLAKALAEGGTELYLQPIVELPSRDVRYFEAFARLRVGDDILTAKQFLPAAKSSEQIAQIDLLSLELTIKVIRGLQREGNDFPVFWNIAPQTLGNGKAFGAILEQLRANKPLNKFLICEFPQAAYAKFNRTQNNNLARIRDLGFKLSLDNVHPEHLEAQRVDDIIESGIFDYLKIPAAQLLRIANDDVVNFANYIVPLADQKNITLIASEVETDSQSMAMIDGDIFLAQGDALMPAKALKKELGKV